jgi:hypothetical protein
MYVALSNTCFITGSFSAGNQTNFDAFRIAETGDGLNALQNILEGFVLSLIVLVFFVVGGRCSSIYFCHTFTIVYAPQGFV